MRNPCPATREQPLLAATRGRPHSNEDPGQPKKLFFNSPIYQTVQSYLLLPITSAEYDVGTYMLKIVKVA